ncbi:MAG: hypothetical protein Q7R61_01415 [bacterium]|nr:hypothetical protein [bacterium]
MKKNKNTIDIKRMVLGLKPLSIKGYEKLDLDRLVIYALYMLEEKGIPLYFDYICVGLFKLFPRKFSLANFKQYPDVFRIHNAVRRTTGALSDKDKKRWANGSSEHGFSLTDLGREIAKQVARLIENPKLQKDRVKHIETKTRGRSFSDDVQEIKESDTFKKWQSDQDINNYEFFAFLKAASYTPKQLIAEHLKRLKTSAMSAKDKEVLKFLSWLENKFQNLLH